MYIMLANIYLEKNIWPKQFYTLSRIAENVSWNIVFESTSNINVLKRFIKSMLNDMLFIRIAQLKGLYNIATHVLLFIGNKWWIVSVDL